MSRRGVDGARYTVTAASPFDAVTCENCGVPLLAYWRLSRCRTCRRTAPRGIPATRDRADGRRLSALRRAALGAGGPRPLARQGAALDLLLKRRGRARSISAARTAGGAARALHDGLRAGTAVSPRPGSMHFPAEKPGAAARDLPRRDLRPQRGLLLYGREKRGVPHIHFLLFLAKNAQFDTVDQVVQAEIPIRRSRVPAADRCMTWSRIC
jgi:hypothetical protein